MRTSKTVPLNRAVASLLALFLMAPVAQAAPWQAQDQQQQPAAQQRPQATPSGDASSPAPDAPQPQLEARPAHGQADQQNNKPVGTAAAPEAKPTGIAASRPAGAVIAPAKQRRVKSIVIRVGLIVGAAVAVGTVVALSQSSSARP